MKLLVLSDLHNEFALAVADAEAVARVDVIVLVGDIHTKDRSVEWARAFVDDPAKPVILVVGNHEFYQGNFDHTLDKAPRACAGRRRSVHVSIRRSRGTRQTMRVFVDTEFTDFVDCDLISIALVADDGREFYAECDDFDRNTCSAFVHEAVLPQLGQYPDRVFSRASLQLALLAWLQPFEGGIFCMDFPGDWDLLVDILDGVPNGWQGLLVRDQADQGRLESYYKQFGGRHHALHDARALRYAMQDGTSSTDAAQSSSD